MSASSLMQRADKDNKWRGLRPQGKLAHKEVYSAAAYRDGDYVSLRATIAL